MAIVSNLSLVKKSFIEIEYDAHHDWLYIKWMGPANEEMGMVGCEDIILALQQYPVKKILNDNRHVYGSWQEDMQWVLDSWFHRFLSMGCFYIAWVQSSCPECQASLEQALPHEIPPMTIFVFEDVETAVSWLKEV